MREYKRSEVVAANQRYYAATASTYNQSLEYSFIRAATAQKRLSETLTLCKDAAGSQLLVDLCCGTGNMLTIGQTMFDRCVGIDISPQMLKEAKKSAAAPLAVANAYQLPFPDQCANVVTCISALHHMFDLDPIFAEVLRILKPGGIFYADIDPNGAHLRARYQKKLPCMVIDRLYKGFAFCKGKRDDVLSHFDDGQCAEYHVYESKSGFMPQQLQERLLGIGFTDAGVFLHSNSASLVTPRRGLFSIVVKEWVLGVLAADIRYQTRASFVATLARKEGRLPLK